jgi:glutamyl/glutaminyl-tRNA synthetase
MNLPQTLEPAMPVADGYRGRLAPTPSGYLHLGHARTFWIAAQRAVAKQGVLVLRNEDLDRDRCRTEFVEAMLEDLAWLGLTWHEGPDVGGPAGPYRQSQRLPYYRDVWKALHAAGVIYPSPHSRKDVQQALLAPHDDRAEPVFPASLRPPMDAGRNASEPGAVNWRFRVPDGRRIVFVDRCAGLVVREAGKDFGDFVVWRRDGLPSYELAVVADDHAMRISEVVRGEDLITSTARQLLLYEALNWTPPAFCHLPLLCDAKGRRLAKRDGALALRTLRAQRRTPQEVRQLCSGCV